jgi:hypothetical protein
MYVVSLGLLATMKHLHAFDGRGGFRSTLTASIASLGVLGFLGALGFVTGRERFFGFMGMFGLIGVAFLVEMFAWLRNRAV